MQLIEILRLPSCDVAANFTLAFRRVSGHAFYLDDLATSFSPFFPRRKNRTCGFWSVQPLRIPRRVRQQEKAPKGPSALSPFLFRAHGGKRMRYKPDACRHDGV